jgi:hypothetical protein
MEDKEPYLVNNDQAAHALGVKRTYITALKKAAGCSGSHRFKLQWLTDYLDVTPGFRCRDYSGRNRVD